MRRVISAESGSGVVMQVTDLLDTDKADLCTNIWGFDEIPVLPLTPGQVLGEYKRLGLYGPGGGLRVNVVALPPESGGKVMELEAEVAKLDFGTGGNLTGSEYGAGGMHRTDSIDLGVVLKGETDIDYAGENGQLRTITVRAGDFIAQNGTFHEWRNRSNAPCIILLFVLAAERASVRAANTAH